MNLKKILNPFKGTMKRKEFIVLLIISLFVQALAQSLSDGAFVWVGALMNCLMFYILFVAYMKRFCDVGIGWYWALGIFSIVVAGQFSSAMVGEIISLIFLIVLLVLCVLPSNYFVKNIDFK